MYEFISGLLPKAIKLKARRKSWPNFALTLKPWKTQTLNADGNGQPCEDKKQKMIAILKFTKFSKSDSTNCSKAYTKNTYKKLTPPKPKSSVYTFHYQVQLNAKGKTSD